MRRFCLLAALAAGSTVLYAQTPCTPTSTTPCISSLQSGYAGSVPPTPTNGAAITAGTAITDFWLYINGTFSAAAFNSVTWTSATTSVITPLTVISGSSTTQLIADVPASLFTTQDSATVKVTQTCFTAPCPGTATAVFTVNPALAGLALPAGAVGQAYSQPLASGGTGPYTISFSAGTTPPGMTSYVGEGVSQATTNYSGTPTTAGTYPFSMLISDSWGNSITPRYSMTVVPLPGIVSLNPASCTVSTNATAGCTTGTFPLQINGANFFSGLSAYWDGASIGGTTINANLLTTSVPHGLLTVGTHLVSVGTAAGVSSGRVAFVVNPAPALTYLTPNPVNAGSTAFTMTVNGGNFLPGMRVQWQGPTGSYLLIPITLSATQITVTVPAGLVTNVGAAAVTVLSADPVPVVSNALTLTVTTPPRPPLVITTSSPLTQATVGVTYSNGFAATGGDGLVYNFSIVSGALPPGLTLSLAGQLTGSPTSPGTFNFTVQVADGSGDTGSKAFVLVVIPSPLTITSPPFTPVPVGTALNVTFAARGGVPPYAFSSSGTLPPNAVFNSSGNLTATLNTPGTYAFAVTVTDSVQSTASQGYTITVTGTALSIVTTSPLTQGSVGVVYPGVQFQASGGTGTYSWAAGSLPPGMSFSAAGALSGTPTAAGKYSVAVTVTDTAKATASGNFTIIISNLAITTASLPNGTVGTPYNAPNMAATGGVGSLTWSAGGLPAGITLSSAGAFGGTPTTAGGYTVGVTVTDSQGDTASRSYTLTVSAPPPLSITITGTVPSTVTVGSSFSVGFAASGGVPPYSYAVSGLPAGTISSGTGGSGTISGTPTAPGSSTVTVTVTDSAGATASASFTVTATLPATPPLNLTGISGTVNPGSQSTVGVTLGSPYPVSVTVTLTLAFTGTDPAVQFSTGGTTATITVPAGQTTGLTTVGVQTGTVAGTITITARLQAGTQDITPTPAPSSTITVPATAPAISSITATRNSTGFTVTIVGYSSTLAITTANFTFNGTNLGTTSLSVPVNTIFASWYGSAAAGQYGSNFTYTQPFNTSSSSQAVTSVAVTLVNGVGTSASMSANLQ